MAEIVRHGWTLAQRKEAFEIWFAQLAVNGTRSPQDVADIMGIPVHVIKKWAADDDWNGKADKRDAKIEAKLEQLGVKKVADIKADYYKRLAQLLEGWFAKNLDDEAQKNLLLATMGAEDVIKIMKFVMVLLDQPDAIKKIEGTVTHSIEDKLSRLSDADLRALVAGETALPYVDAEVIPDGQ